MPKIKGLDKYRLLGKLPTFYGKSRTIADDQSTFDIINEVLRKHAETKDHYDFIAQDFAGGNAEKKLFDFCKYYLPYKQEPAGSQSTMTPAGILIMAEEHGVDCKHYAGFIAGVLDALNRQGYNYKIKYRFAGYDGSRVNHVFVVVTKNDGSEIWIDPTPIIDRSSGRVTERSFNDRRAVPVTIVDKKIKKDIMALSTMNGLAQDTGVVGEIPDLFKIATDSASGSGSGGGGGTTTTPAPAPGGSTGSGSLVDAAKTDPQAGAIVGAAQSLIDQLPESGLKNFLKDYIKNPLNAFRRLYFGKPFTSGAYRLGETYMRNILGMAEIQNRGQVTDAYVPQACEFFTVALGVRIGSQDHLDQLALGADAYYKWLGSDANDIPRANVERAHRILLLLNFPANQSNYQRNEAWPLSKFEAEPYLYPIVGMQPGSLYSGTNPINNVVLEKGYPSNSLPSPSNPGGLPTTYPGKVPTGSYASSSLVKGILVIGALGFVGYLLTAQSKEKR